MSDSPAFDIGKFPVHLGLGATVVRGYGQRHAADVDAPCTALFITSGFGTQNRPR